MSMFTDVVHKVATIGAHTIEYVEGHPAIVLNGALVAAEDVVRLLEALQEVAPLMAAVAAE